jgi:GTP-binding protein HflX
MERSILVNVSTTKREKDQAEESLEELAGLVRAAGAEVVHKMFQVRSRINPHSFLGKGKVEEVVKLLEELPANLVVFDHNLSPAQKHSLEDETRAKILDRTELILDIFAQRARTNEGKLQVELAQLSYLLPRLKGRGVGLTQQGAGIGTRGPGEKKLEEDRRRINDRITKIKKDIAGLQNRRSAQRESRRKSPVPTVALVGYTSAGKSTLFNFLTEERRYTSPNLFATLDPLLRRVQFDDGLSFFLSDTVGFIKKLPGELVSSFRATLEELKEADCICHVIDCSTPYALSHLGAVRSILEDLGVAGVPILEVTNKIDLLPVADREILLQRNSRTNGSSAAVSALTGEGIPELLRNLRDLLYRNSRLYYLRIPRDRPEIFESLSRRSQVLKKRDNEHFREFKVMADPSVIVHFLPYLERGGEPW